MKLKIKSILTIIQIIVGKLYSLDFPSVLQCVSEHPSKELSPRDTGDPKLLICSLIAAVTVTGDTGPACLSVLDCCRYMYDMSHTADGGK